MKNIIRFLFNSLVLRGKLIIIFSKLYKFNLGIFLYIESLYNIFFYVSKNST